MIKKFTIPNMSCAHCQARIESQIQNLKGVESFEIQLQDKAGSITFNPDRLSPDQIVEELRKINYQLEWSDD